ncbi:polymorphic toxin-type HINT domain-containing protein, partial [Kitasatospora sp. NPDC057512]|uniref:polymorphic toxin-type HINT domain-containing protein n=1 Tax=Kitasatospora sp. NPDC057512 TaxID=3346154 RepID=UPI00368ECC8E
IPFIGDGAAVAKLAQWAKKFGSWGEKAVEFIKKLVGRLPPPCPGLNSFPAGTRVLMADGSTRAIESVRTGDDVLATDPTTGLTGPRRVSATIYTPDDRDFTAVSLGAGQTLTSTDHHPFWSENRKQWTDAADLKAGDDLRDPTGQPRRVEDVRHWSTLQPAYNLTVDDLHTYYVLAGETPVLVHNSNEVCHLWRSEFDKLPMGKQNHVREQPTEEAMRALFERWTAGAERLPARGPIIPDVFRLKDGTVIQWRTKSSSPPHGATIDISPGSGGKDLKVHLPHG